MNNQHPSAPASQARTVSRRTVSRRTVATGLAWAAPVAVAIAAAPAQAASPIPCDQAATWEGFFLDVGFDVDSSTGTWSLPWFNYNSDVGLTTTLTVTFTDGTSATSAPLILGPAASDGTPSTGSVDVPLGSRDSPLRALARLDIASEDAFGPSKDSYAFDSTACSIVTAQEAGGRE